MAQGNGNGWTFETLLTHLDAMLDQLHHEVEGRESLWRKEYDAKIDGLRCHVDDYWARMQAQDDEIRTAIDRADLNLAQRIEDLRRYHDQSVESNNRAITAAMAASDKAIEKSERSTERRLDSFVGAISRDEYMAAHQALVDRVDGLQARIDKSEGAGIGKNQMWGYAVAIVAALGTIIVVANVFLDHALT